jgi:archaeal flagellar protein FlaG
MGFSVTGSHVVIFIASVIAAGAVSGVFMAVTYGINSSLSERGARVQELLDTEFVIINDPENIPSTASDYIFYLQNIGAKQLVTTTDTFTLFIDGEITTTNNFNFSDDKIKQGEISNLYIDNSMIATGDHILRVVGPQAVDDEFIFTI